MSHRGAASSDTRQRRKEQVRLCVPDVSGREARESFRGTRGDEVVIELGFILLYHQRETEVRAKGLSSVNDRFLWV